MDTSIPIEKEKLFRLRGRVEDINKDTTRYRAKIWPARASEPEGWDIENDSAKRAAPSGSAMLLAHYSEVTFGDIEVTPLKTPQPNERH